MGEFSGNLPVGISIPFLTEKPHLTCGLDFYFATKDKASPLAEKASLACLPSGIGKRTVEIVGCIIFTMIAAPIFSILGILYNATAAAIKTWYGAVRYFATKERGVIAQDEVNNNQHPEILLNEALQHFLLACMDFIFTISFSLGGLAGRLTAVISATGFAFHQKDIKKTFYEMEEYITTGKAYDRVKKFCRKLGLTQVARDKGYNQPYNFEDTQEVEESQEEKDYNNHVHNAVAEIHTQRQKKNPHKRQRRYPAASTVTDY